MRIVEQSQHAPLPDERNGNADPQKPPEKSFFWQFLRFGLVGCLNTLIDLLVLNCLLWLWPTRNTGTIILDNSFAYALGAVNSFVLNRYWTFHRNGRPEWREVLRFTLTTLAGIACNDLILGGVNNALQTMHLSTTLWTNIAKLVAIGGTILISYLGMRLWVFVHHAPEEQMQAGPEPQQTDDQTLPISTTRQPKRSPATTGTWLTTHSLSVVLPVYNEEHIIATTIKRALHILESWMEDFELIVINDGSTDHTGDILTTLSHMDERVRVVTHECNQGYGATLADGFAAATKELTFFMDSDGQFDLQNLEQFFQLIDQFDAIIGYRLQRQDTWMRKLNAWGWKNVVRLALGVHVQDIDCAFKLLRTDFLQGHLLETRGAMINAELLYKLKQANCSIKEIGVQHLPRQGGRATGARLSVIVRAFGELFLYAHKWRRETISRQTSHSLPEKQLSTHSLQKEHSIPMLDTDTNIKQGPAGLSAEQNRSFLPLLWQKLALSAIMLVSIFMNFYQLGQNGFGNLFYAAGVRSMADSLHNFFFVSYDPGGFVTIDKPPVGFWLQALSVKLFGFTPFSIFFPQALAGVLAVLVLFVLVRRHFGVTAGLLAALALALSPLSVATNRNNTIDSTLALTLLLAAWAIMHAAESGKWRWLLLSAALVGLGFNIKMMEAYLVIPALGLLYLLAAPRKIWLRLVQLAVAVLVLLMISLSWAVVVDMIPAAQRPYVGSSQDNSEVSLAFGYNGIDRLLGRFGFGTGDAAKAGGSNDAPRSPASTSGQTTSGTGNSADADSQGSRFARSANGRAGGMGSGSPGPFRLFNAALGGQIAWLLPIALLAILALALQGRPRFQQNRQQHSLILWGTWVCTMGIFFSVASFFHTYYMTTFAPAICALFGIGLVVMWQDYRRSGWRGWLLPLALFLTACEQVYIISSNPGWGSWLIPLIAIPSVLAALVLSVARLVSHLEINPRLLLSTLGLGLVALLLTPAVWAAMPGVQNKAPSTPQAGPSQQFGAGGFGNRNSTGNNTALIRYLEANQGNAKYLVATPSSMSADSIIMATNKPVMAMGGFSGSDPILTQSQLASLVANGTVRFFLLNSSSRLFQSGNGPDQTSRARNGVAAIPDNQFAGFGFGSARQNTLTTWVTQHCTTIAASAWQSSANSSQSTTPGATKLYDCAAK